MAPDRTVSWLQKSLSKKNTFVPEEFIAAFNSICSVEAEFIDHLDNGRLIYERWKKILKAHLAPIPAIKDGGYTKYHFFEFQNGILKMRHSTESNIEHTHVYVQRGSTQVNDITYDTLVAQCVKSFERHLFYTGKTFSSATPLDINVTSSFGLMRHGKKGIQESQLKSFWTKGFSIPTECLSYYPPQPTMPLVAEAVPEETHDGPVKKRSRKSQQSHASKIIEKNIVKPTSASAVSKNSLARYFTPAAVVNITSDTIGYTKISKEPMVWHRQVTPIKAKISLGRAEEDDYEWRGEEEENGLGARLASVWESTPLAGEGSAHIGECSSHVGEGSAHVGEHSVHVGEGSVHVGEGSALAGKGSSQVGEGSVHVGEGSALVGEGSTLNGEGSALVGEQSVPPIPEGHVVYQRNGNKVGEQSVPPIPEGHVVYQRNGNKVVTGPAPSRYDGMSELLPRPGIGFCNFCGSSTRHCKLKYSGCNMSSCPAKHVIYSFP